MSVENISLCSEWAEDPIELEIRIRRAESDGWQRKGIPFKQRYGGTNVPIGNYVQTLYRELDAAQTEKGA